MSPGFHIADDEGLISIQVSDAIDLADLYDLAKNLLDADAYDPNLPLLVDLRGMRIQLVKEALDPFNHFIVTSFSDRHGSTAVVIDTDMSRKLSAAIYWLACAVGHTEVFDDYDHALKWLIRQEFAGNDDATGRLPTDAEAASGG